MRWLILFLGPLVLLSSNAVADHFSPPIPKMWSSTDGRTIAEVFPPETVHNKSKTATFAYVYDVFRTPVDYSVATKVLWKGALVSQPAVAMLLKSGQLVTLDRHGRTGYDDAIVVYDATGKLLKSHHLDSLRPKEIADAERSVSNRQWRLYTTYHLEKTTLYILLHQRGRIDVSLVDGSATFKKGENAIPPGAASVELGFGSELGYATLTDVQRACRP